MCAYARRVLVQPRGPQPYERQYKGVAAALQLLSRALAGGYVNFGVFELYGDPALKGAPRGGAGWRRAGGA